MTSRWQVEAAIAASDLGPHQRLIVMMLLTRADSKTAIIPAQHTPSLTDLVAMTGLARSTVAKELNALEGAGWVDRRRPSVAAARSAKAKTQYRITIPAGPSHGLELVRHTDQTEVSASPYHGPALVRVTDISSPPHGLNNNLEPSSSSSARVQTRIAAALGVEEEEAELIYKRILTERNPAAPSRYIDSLIASGDISRFRTATRPAAIYTGARCSFSDPGDGSGLCATCHMPKPHARHGAAA